MPVHEPRVVEVIFIFHCIFWRQIHSKERSIKESKDSKVILKYGQWRNVENGIYTIGNYHRSSIGVIWGLSATMTNAIVT